MQIKDIIKQTPFVVVAGVATQHYVPERETKDLDILVLSKDAVKARKELEEVGGRHEHYEESTGLEKKDLRRERERNEVKRDTFIT